MPTKKAAIRAGIMFMGVLFILMYAADLLAKVT